MFSLKTNTSKFCLLYLIALLKKNNFTLLDSQFFNHHLLQFGGYEIKTEVYENQLEESLKKISKFNNLNNFQEALSLIQSTSHKS